MLEQMAEYEDDFADLGYDMNDIENMAGGGMPNSLGKQDVGNDEGDEL